MKDKRDYAKAHFLMGVSDFLQGIVTMAYSFCILCWPNRYVNEVGQYTRSWNASKWLTNMHMKALRNLFDSDSEK